MATELKSEVQWAIVSTIKHKKGTWSGIIDRSTACRRKTAIEDFVKWYGHPWEVAKENGYQVVKLHCNYLIKIL